MTPEAQRIAIAEACGWIEIKMVEGFSGKPPYQIIFDLGATGLHPAYKARHHLPNYLNDLNAMHEAVQTLNDADWERFLHHCETIVARGESKRGMTAPQSCEAFLRTISKWEESK